MSGGVNRQGERSGRAPYLSLRSSRCTAQAPLACRSPPPGASSRASLVSANPIQSNQIGSDRSRKVPRRRKRDAERTFREKRHNCSSTTVKAMLLSYFRFRSPTEKHVALARSLAAAAGPVVGWTGNVSFRLGGAKRDYICNYLRKPVCI